MQRLRDTIEAIAGRAAAAEGPRTVASLLVDKLRTDIVAGAFAPGDRLKLADLSLRYGSGISPLREALTRLAATGLVLIEDQKGFRVAPMSRADLLDLTGVRQRLESWALGEAIARGDVEWEARIVSAHHRLARLSRTAPGDGRALDDTWESLHQDFHRALVSACGSPWLLHFRNVLADQASRYRRLSVAYAEAARDIAAEHAELMAAVLARDTARATALVEAHFARTAAIVLEGYDRLQGGGAAKGG